MRGLTPASGSDDALMGATTFRLSATRAGARAGQSLVRSMFAHKGLPIGAGMLTLIVLTALLAPVVAPFDPYVQDLGHRLTPPIWYHGGSFAHILGTDNLGRDYLSRVIYGARISLVIGFAVMAISGLIGAGLGL